MKTLRFIALMVIMMVIFKSEMPLNNVSEMQDVAPLATTTSNETTDVVPLYSNDYVTVYGPMYVLPNTLYTYIIEPQPGCVIETEFLILDSTVSSADADFDLLQDMMSTYTFFSSKTGAYYVRIWNAVNNSFIGSFPIICVSVLPY